MEIYAQPMETKVEPTHQGHALCEIMDPIGQILEEIEFTIVDIWLDLLRIVAVKMYWILKPTTMNSNHVRTFNKTEPESPFLT